jgi:hypothetical protein
MACRWRCGTSGFESWASDRPVREVGDVGVVVSVTVEYLFNTDANLSDLAQAVNRILGCSLAPYEGDAADQYCRFCGMELTLRTDHGLKRDGELNFEDYQFVLDTRTPIPDSDLRPIQVEVMVVAAYVLHRRLGIDQGMLTFDVQRLLAHYEVVDGEWTDKVSGTAVRFPGHLSDVKRCVPPSCEEFA